MSDLENMPRTAVGNIKFTAPRLYPTPPLFTAYSPTLDFPYKILDIGVLLPPDVVPRAILEAGSGVLAISLRTPRLPTAGGGGPKYQETVKYTIEVPTQWLFWDDGQSSPWKVDHAKLTEDQKSFVGGEFSSCFRVVFFGEQVDITELLEKKLVLTPNRNDGNQIQEMSSLISPL